MINRNILVFMGNIGSGKDTAADYFVNNLGYTKIAFADPLKEFVQVIFEFSNETLWGPSERRNDLCAIDWNRIIYNAENKKYVEDQIYCWFMLGNEHITAFDSLISFLEKMQYQKEPLTARYVLQQIGTEWGRALKPSLWILALIEKILNDNKTTKYIIPDCRFLNELSSLKSGFKGTKAYWIDPGERVLNNSNHASEGNYEMFKELLNGKIMNDGTLEEFINKLKNI